VKNWAEISAERLTANYRILKQTVDEQVDVLAVIKADAAVSHGRVIHVLDLLKQAEVSKIAFGVQPTAPGVAPAPPPK